jgi:hypothetical protein
MKHFLIIFPALCIILFIAIFSYGLFYDGSQLAVRQESWVTHNDRISPPTSVCAVNQANCNLQTSTSSPTADSVAAEIKISSPAANQVIASPLEISGQALGRWYFEGSFPVKLIGDNGEIIAQGFVTAQSDWMNQGFVPFKGELKFNNTTSTLGMLIFSNDNPSGLPQNEKQYGVPISFSDIQQMPVKVYFSNDNLNKDITDCSQVFPVDRLIVKTKTTARSAMEQLLAGAMSSETNQGYYSSINPDVKINSLTISNGTAKIDFYPQIEYQLGGSCRVAAIRAQITKTLEQFPTVQNVVISVNGDVKGALQP